MARQETLEEIERELLDMAQQIEAAHAEGVDVPHEYVERFHAYLAQRGAKIDRTMALMSRLEDEAAWARKESKLYQLRAQRKEATVERIKEMVRDVMLTFGQTRLEGRGGHFTLIDGQPTLNITDIEMIPREYFNEPPPPQPVLMKDVVKQDLKNGMAVPGAELKDGEPYVRVYR